MLLKISKTIHSSAIGENVSLHVSRMDAAVSGYLLTVCVCVLCCASYVFVFGPCLRSFVPKNEMHVNTHLLRQRMNGLAMHITQAQ